MNNFLSIWTHQKWRKNFSIYLYLGLSVFLLSLTLGSYRLFHTLEVTLENGDEVRKVASRAEKVGDLLAEQGIVPGAHDRVSPGLEEPLEEGLHILIQKAVPLIFTTDTGSYRHYTHAETVYGAFQELGIPLTGNIVVEPELDASLYPGKEICFYRRVEVVETFEESIPFEVKKEDDAELLRGRQRVLQEGKEGRKELRFKVVYAGGRELLRKLIAETILQQPVPLVLAVGTKISSPGSAPARLASRGTGIEGQASWYGAKFHGKKTSSGELYNQNDFTAAHPYLPFGTRLKVTYLRTGKSVTVRVNDRGPHLGGRVIDLSRAAAEAIGLRSHGVGQVSIEVL